MGADVFEALHGGIGCGSDGEDTYATAMATALSEPQARILAAVAAIPRRQGRQLRAGRRDRGAARARAAGGLGVAPCARRPPGTVATGAARRRHAGLPAGLGAARAPARLAGARRASRWCAGAWTWRGMDGDATSTRCCGVPPPSHRRAGAPGSPGACPGWSLHAPRRYASRMELRLPPVTLALLIALAAGYGLQLLLGDGFSALFALWPLGPHVLLPQGGGVDSVGFEIWQLVSYGFLHGSGLHLAFNASRCTCSARRSSSSGAAGPSWSTTWSAWSARRWPSSRPRRG